MVSIRGKITDLFFFHASFSVNQIPILTHHRRLV
jgi:hypothetical protein